MNWMQFATRAGVVAILASATVWSAPESAHAQWYVTGGGGAEFPTGNFNDTHNGGAYFDLEVGREVARRVGIGVFGSLGLLGGETFNVANRFGDVQVWRYGLNGQIQAVDPAMTNLRVVLGAGLGGATSSVNPGAVAGVPLPGGSVTNFMLDGNVYFGYGMARNVMVGVGSRFYLIFNSDPRLATGTDMTSFTVQLIVAWKQL
jgi:hypothetical protein